MSRKTNISVDNDPIKTKLYIKAMRNKDKKIIHPSKMRNGAFIFQFSQITLYQY